MTLWEWKKKLDRIEAEQNAIHWSPVPGKLLAGLVCLVAGHDPELMQIQFGAPIGGTPIVSHLHYRCRRCRRTGSSR